MKTSTITSKGQATIPKEIRDYLGVKPSERIAFNIDNGQVVLRRASYTTAEVAGCLKATKPFPTKTEMRKAVEGEAVKRYLRAKG